MSTTMDNRYWDGDTERMAPVGHQVRTAVPPRPMAQEQGSVPGTRFASQHEYGAPRDFGGEQRYGYDGASTALPPARTAMVQPAEPVEQRPVVDATRLWSGGLATAIVAALIGLVGVLVVRVAFHVALYAPAGAATLGSSAAVTTLCLVSAAAALAATGLAHLLLMSTPRPLAYLGWIVGLATAAATVIPFLGATSMAVATAAAVIHLVIGLAIGSLVAGSAAAASRGRRLH
ncbi:DUF6069 family protein [Pseudonocardia sp. N23]|uniref:DUF6069 family protein n=1 Tax=Pseudonocardia sp. N23 TaxID=1987376 RepID=UPI000C032C75|nr:DUF6069 family protein [Pseudonocardia sp. N23]GAY09009.1 hypothetical protein TOK_2965 [Pseudonocardia sp. N23]